MSESKSRADIMIWNLGSCYLSNFSDRGRDPPAGPGPAGQAVTVTVTSPNRTPVGVTITMPQSVTVPARRGPGQQSHSGRVLQLNVTEYITVTAWASTST